MLYILPWKIFGDSKCAPSQNVPQHACSYIFLLKRAQFLVSLVLSMFLHVLLQSIFMVKWINTPSRDTGQRKLCFDRCQLIKTWMSDIKDVCSTELKNDCASHWSAARNTGSRARSFQKIICSPENDSRWLNLKNKVAVWKIRILIHFFDEFRCFSKNWGGVEIM